MKNLLLDQRTSRDIDNRVNRIHSELGYQGGKVELAEVRGLLRLDLSYYTVDQPGLFGELVHKLKVGAQQVIKRPALLLEAVRKFDLKALFVPDRKQILIDATLPDLKKRWAEGHEIVHSVLPWHAEYMLGDTKATLTPGCHEQIESEANYGAGRLFFPAQEFVSLQRALPINLQRIREIATHFGNTTTSTLWRCVENDDRPCFGVIGAHPHRRCEGDLDVEHLIQSPSFADRFSKFKEEEAIRLLRSYCSDKRAGPLGVAEIVISDDLGTKHIFLAETFCTRYPTSTPEQYRYQTLTFAQYIAPRLTRVFAPG
jgi:hypothetical protein